MKTTSDDLLKAYAGILTAAVAGALLTGAAGSRSEKFDEITVQRINVVEPDGTLRLTISGNKRFPGTPIKGRELPRPDRTNMAGLIYLDDEGSEIGGFTWGGKQDKDGKTDAFGHLSFDRYLGDENISLDTWENGGKMESGLVINDSYSGLDASLEPGRIRALPRAEQKAAWDAWSKKYPSTQRLVIARLRDNSVIQMMKDAQGRARMILKVDPKGEPSIELLDAEGKVTARLPAAAR